MTKAMDSTVDNKLIDRYINEGLRGLSDNTIKAYTRSIRQFAGSLSETSTDLNNYARSDVQAHLSALEQAGRSASSVKREYAAIRSFSRWIGNVKAVEDIRITEPQSTLETAPKWLTRSERLRLIRETERKTNKRDHALVMTMLHTGVRVSELVSLDRSDITMSDRKGSVHVRNGKGGKERVIPLGADARRAIRMYLEQRGDDNIEALFTSQYGKRISVRSVQSMLSNYGFNPHQLRHSFVKALVDAGEDTATIMSMSGHTSADMIAWYSAPSIEDKQQAVESLYD